MPPRPTPRRRILNALLLGLLLNTTITTACWLTQPSLGRSTTQNMTEGDSITIWGQDSYLTHTSKWKIQTDPAERPVFTAPQSLADTYPAADPLVYGHNVFSYGVPFRALRFQTASHGRRSQVQGTSPNLNHTLPFWQRGLPTGLQRPRHHRFPTEPTPGFLYNTLIFTAAILLAAELTARLRPRARCRRGECTACRYDLAGLTTCPECGNLQTLL